MSADGTAERSPSRPRIFGVGFNKTGTSSFHEAMTILGFESLHWGGPAIRQNVEASLHAGRPLLSNLDPRYDAFSDVEPLTRNFRLLDEQYPGSRFVLTVRPVEDWIDSRRRHVAFNVRRKEAGEYTGTFLVVDEAAWREDWETHVRAVRRHFSGRADYLEIDLVTNAGWSPLCSLLGVAMPAVPYPWAHATRDRAAGSPSPSRPGP